MYSLPRLLSKSKIIESSEGEDRVNHVRTSTYDICMLADGHGGSFVSTYLSSNLPNLFKCVYHSFLSKFNKHSLYTRAYASLPNRHMREKIDRLSIRFAKMRTDDKQTNDTFAYESALVRALLRIAIDHVSSEQRTQTEGSTLVGFVRTQSCITTFNIGDSRCYAIDTHDKLVQMTRDHNLKCKRECARLNRKHTTYDRRLGGVLAMTRSIGDADVRHVSCTPDITTHKSNKFKLLALVSDGTYEFIEKTKFASLLNSSLTSVQPNLCELRTQLNESCASSDDDRSHLIYIYYANK
jgi:serine/threonine protein phosphatase PrpC